MKARNILALTGLLCLLGSAVPAAAQVIRYVDDDASTNGDGSSWEKAYKYLQDAMFEASGDPTITEIRVAGGTYQPDQDEGGHVTPGNRGATFQLLSDRSIMGGYLGCPGGDCEGGDPNERDVALYVSTLSGDLAGNDIADLPAGLACFSGDGEPYAVGCEAYDVDTDGDVDAPDLGIDENS